MNGGNHQGSILGWHLGDEGFVEKMKGKLKEMREEMPRQRDSWAGEAVEEDSSLRRKWTYIYHKTLPAPFVGSGSARLDMWHPC